jgi:V/A-type H+-transporting ATPase subunit G/H
MTEIDELKVIKSKEEAKKQAVKELKVEMEKRLNENVSRCNETAKNIENQIVNDYNKGIEEIKESEGKKMTDALDTQKARVQVMKVDIKDRELQEKIYSMIIKYIKKK